MGIPPATAFTHAHIVSPSPLLLPPLPSQGKLITGEELCEALERMTNAYIDKYAGTEDKGGANTMPYIATGTRLFMSKKLGQVRPGAAAATQRVTGCCCCCCRCPPRPVATLYPLP